MIVEGIEINSVGTHIITIKETKAPNGYSNLVDEIVFQIETRETEEGYKIGRIELLNDEEVGKNIIWDIGSNSLIVEINNKKKQGKFEIEVVKKDVKGNIITQEAMFNIGGTEYKTQEGKISLSGELKNSDEIVLTVEEIKAPNGYRKLNGKYEIRLNVIEENGEYIVESGKITNENEDIRIKVENGKVEIEVVNRQFDLALRKYIKTIDGEEVKNREPQVDESRLNQGQTTAEKAHSKEPLRVQEGSRVVYRIAVYNEGEISGYASEITDYLPEGLKFVEDSEINRVNGWTNPSGDGRTIVSNKLKDTLLNRYEGEGISKAELEIECEVIAKEKLNSQILKNIAEITKDEDENREEIEDRDSIPGNLTEEEKSEYNPGESEKGWGYEDDDDYENLILPASTIDIALRKYIVQIGETELKEGESYEREPNIDITELKNGTKTTAEYKHTKEVKEVKIGDEIIYNIRVYNEGRMDAYVGEVTDYIPKELEFIEGDELNEKYGWEKQSDGSIKTRALSKGGKLDTEDSPAKLKGFDGETLDYRELKVKCRVKENAEIGRKITNIAEITKYEDEEGKELSKDIDSNSNNVERPTEEELPEYKGNEANKEDLTDKGYHYRGQEDDDDFEKVIVGVREGNYKLEVIKEGDNGEKLKGAIFEITMPNGEKKEIETDAQGILEIPEMTIGEEKTQEIIIREIKAPEGYKKLREDIKIEVNMKIEEGEYRVREVKVVEGEAIVNQNEGKIEIIIENEKIENKYNIEIVKVDSKGNTINQEAIFKVNGEEYGTREGKVSFEGKIENTNEIIYNIEEIKAPEGYIGIKGEIEIKLQVEQKGENYEIKGVNVNPEKEEIKVEINGNTVIIKVVNKQFDLALRKYITKVNAIKPDIDRTPVFKIDENGNYVYEHTKEPVIVEHSDIVTYTIRVYNEGEISGYASEITDDIPEGLEFLPENETNQEYRWVMINKEGNITENAQEAVEIRTDYLSKEQGEIREPEGEENPNLIKAFTGEEPDYKEVKVAFKVIAPNTSDKVIINTAQISDDEDEEGNEVTDKDSIPGNDNAEEDDQDIDKIKLQYFDLALRKFITKVNEEEIGTRDPIFKIDEEGKYVYEHTKEPVLVQKGNVVTYTIRVYNEGTMSGYAKEIGDDIPEGLEFIPENETNQEYRWEMIDKEGNVTEKVEEAEGIRTDYLSKEQEKEEGSNLIEGFDKEAYERGEIVEPKYKEVKVVFKVTEPNTSDRIVINKAQIIEDEDEKGEEVTDIDSIPGEWNEGEDDQDIEKVKVQYFDLALRKWVTEAIVIEKGKETVTQTGHKPEDDPEQVVKVDLNKKDINEVVVKFRYSIRVYNEGEIAGYAKEIKEHIPEGLKFVAEDNPEWREENGEVVTNALAEKLLKPGEYADVEIVLTWINGQDNLGLKENIAEISKDYNESETPDIDSVPDNEKEGEDDIDDAPVILSLILGSMPMYIGLTTGVIVILGIGIFLIKKYVM